MAGHGGKREGAGSRPRSPLGKRILHAVRIAPETDAILAQARRPGESLGQTIDRLVQGSRTVAEMQNHSLAEIRRVIEEGFDPSGILTSQDDPEETLAQIDLLAVQAGGQETELTYADMVEYLAYLATIGR